MNSKTRREITWLCLPLVLIIGAGAWISRAQSERNAEKRRRESGPLRVRVRNIGMLSVPVEGEERAAGYDYGVSIQGDVEGRDIGALAPGQFWMMRVKSVQIRSGKTSKKARVVQMMAPLIHENKTKGPSPDIMVDTEVSVEPRDVWLWLYCDSPLPNPVLNVELEVVAGKVVPVLGTTFFTKFVASGRRIAVSNENIPLRPFDESNRASNIIKSQY